MPSIVFKEWLPDQPELGNPGLIRAENVIPGDGGYEPYNTFTIGSAGFNTVSSGLVHSGIATVSDAGVQFLFLNAGASIFEAINNGVNWTALSVVTAGTVAFTQYDELVIATGDNMTARAKTVGSSSTFGPLASSGTPPLASAIGVIGQFVVLGALDDGADLIPHAVQWSSVDQPRNWPTPGSATAIASQSGQQLLPQQFGKVQAIHGGDQFGVILQEGGVTRMTYIGPPAVFQFDTIDNRHGSYFKQGSIRVGGITYFLSRDGFYKTDGVSVVPIGDGKVDRYFWDSWSGNGADNCCWGYDSTRNVLYFGASFTASANLDSILVFNLLTEKWSYARETDGIRQFITAAPGTDYSDDLYAFSTSANKVCGTFSGTPGTAVLETGEFEPNEGGRSYIDAVKPHVEAASTPSITVSVGYREVLNGLPSYSSEAAANSRTGFANMRVDAKYIRFRETITGNFEKATGLEFIAKPSGSA